MQPSRWVVSHGLLHKGQKEHTNLLPELLLQGPLEGFQHHFCVQTSQRLHTSILCLGGACCYAWGKRNLCLPAGLKFSSCH